MTRTVTESLDRHTPKIGTRTLPHPAIDEEMKKMEEAGRIRTFHAKGINFRENKRILTRLRLELREEWREKREIMWRELVERTDLEKKTKKILESSGEYDGEKQG